MQTNVIDRKSAAQQLSKLSRITACVVAQVTSVVFGLFALSGNFGTVFGPIDDHEPLSWLDSEGNLSPSQFFDVLIGRTEFGDFGESSRFRPSYYFVRVGQATLFGDDPALWYFFAFLLFVTTVALLAFATWLWVALGLGQQRPLIEITIAVAATSAGVTMFGSVGAWTGIVARLGPSELLAMFGVSVILVSSTFLVGNSSGWWWVPALTGTVLAVGSKENFLLLVLVPIGISVYRFATRRNMSSLFPAFLSLLFASALLAGMSATIGQGGKDVYGQSIDGSRALNALSALSGTYAAYWVPGALLVLGAGTLWLLAHPRPPRDLRALMVYLVLSGFVWLMFDAWTYRGIYEMTRYWVVFDFLKVLAIVASIAFAVSVFAHRRGRVTRGASLVVLTASLCLACLQVAAAPQAVGDLRNEVRANALAASTWSAGVAAVLRDAQILRQAQIVIIPSGPTDFEPIVALAGAANRQGIDTFVLVAEDTSGPEIPIGAAPIRQFQVSGWKDPKITPLADIQRDRAVLCVFLNSQLRDVTGCSPDRSFTLRARGI